MKVPRCVNLDWLEVYVLEPISEPRDADYFASLGMAVSVREYGTRVYSQMFTIMGTDGLPLLEVRRAPSSSLTTGGILPVNATHIRLVNRTCYYDDAALKMSAFLETHGYTFVRISRVDICLDFERFDSGDYPERFLRRYLEGRFAKINQARIHAHGEDAWTTRRWNSVSWGAPTSQVSTKFYCKSQELREVKDKPYIKQAWFICGLVDDPITCEKHMPNGTVYVPDIWRLEFSIRSDVKRWFVIEQDGVRKRKRSIPNTLDCYSSRARILAIFQSLAQHYFHFKAVAEAMQRAHFDTLPNAGLVQAAMLGVDSRNVDCGVAVPRKDRCPDKVLFKWAANEPYYKVEHLAGTLGNDKQLLRLRQRLEAYAATHTTEDVRHAVSVLLQSITEDYQRNELADPWSRAELTALQSALDYRRKNRSLDPARIVDSLLSFIREHSNEIF